MRIWNFRPSQPFRRLALAALLTTCLSPASAANRALLVGVSDYPAASVGDLQLTGPRNDIALMLKTLRGAGFADADMTVLADGFEKTGETRAADGAPTRAAIMGALEKLASEAAPGDQIAIVLSGHGSLAPITDPASLAHHPDGLNPIFLPIDIGKWNDTVGKVENAIAGDEFGVALTAIRNKGAFVWVVVDACHSGTITRSAEPDMIAKKVAPAALGVPEAKLAAARAMAGKGGTRSLGGAPTRQVSPLGAQPAAEGGYVAFFAAHPDELAIQRNMPKGYGEERRPHGVLIFYLAQALRSGRASSYADLAQMVLAGYDQWGASAPSPLFEGDLRRGVLGARADGARTFAARADGGVLRIEAGVLDEVSDGAIVSLATAADGGAPLGYARVTGAGPSSATAEPVEFGGKSAPALRALADEGRLVARVEERGLSLEMIVAAPAFAAPPSPAQARVQKALEAIELPAAVKIVAANAPRADVRLVIDGERLWIAGEDGAVVREGRERTPNFSLSGFRTPGDAQDMIAAALKQQFKVKNLIRAAEAMRGAPAGALEITGAVWRPEPAPAPASARAPDDRPCPKPQLDRVPADATPLGDGLDPPALGHCDVVYFTLRNTGQKPIDVTPLYVDGGAGVGYMGPAEGLRLLPGAPARVVPIPIVTWDRAKGEPYPIGLERLLFVAVEQEDKTSLPADFRYLEEPALPRNAKAGGSPALKTLLDNAAFGAGKTRSTSAGAAVGAAGIVQYRWKVVAP